MAKFALKLEKHGSFIVFDDAADVTEVLKVLERCQVVEEYYEGSDYSNKKYRVVKKLEATVVLFDKSIEKMDEPTPKVEVAADEG